jgi:hypothetical protein
MDRPPRAVSLLCALALIACGKKSETATAKDDAAVGPSAAPLAMPPLGVDQVKRFNFSYEAGAPAQDRAIAAYRKKDWPAVRIQAEAALAKDPGHLGAHRLLAAALAATGEPAAAVDHLVTAIAADYYQYAPTLGDDDLKGFMASPHGQAVAALAARIRAAYSQRIAGGLWLVARRSPFRWPSELGVQGSTSRGELYAFDRETKRLFRLTHTEHQVVGFVRAASGKEVAVIGFDRIDRPRPEPSAAGAVTLPSGSTAAAGSGQAGSAGSATGDAAPGFARPWIQIYDPAEWKPPPRIALPAAREIALGYAAGDQLVIATAQATGRWTVGEPVVSSIDHRTGKLSKTATALPAPRIVVTLDEGRVVRIPDGVTASWTGDPPAAPNLRTAAGGDKPIQIPESGLAAQSSIALAPDGQHVAFATAVDPCAKDTAPSLYVADARTGVARHILSAASRFATRWVDPSTVAYEDGDGAIRLWSAATGREAERIENRAGIALDALALASAPLCKQAPPTVDTGPAEEPLPPEEPAGSATAPQ